MSYLDDLERDAMVCWICEEIVTPAEIKRGKFDKADDPETFDDIYSHSRCTPIPVERIEDNARTWPR